MIWAQARDGAIGRDGVMPWHLPEDLAHFRSVTTGAPVVMGRRTWESLPERFRPLPARRNIVVTRDPVYDAPGASVVFSLEDALAMLGDPLSGAPADLPAADLPDEPPPERAGASPAEAPLANAADGRPLAGSSSGDPRGARAWIIGGGQLYRAAMPLADELVVTRIEAEVYDANTFAPEIGPEWRLADPGEELVSRSGLRYRFERWVRG